jgi:hypothetical protein
LGDKLNTGKIEFGLDGGMNLVDINGISGTKQTPRFNLGFYFDFRLKNPSWMFHTGVIVKSTMGAENIKVYALNDSRLDTIFIDGRVERTINYFHVPFMMKYKISKSFYTEAGIMLGLRYKSYDVFKKSVEKSDDLTYEKEISDQYHRIDAGVIAGIGYRLMGGNGMNLGIRYYSGVMNARIDDSTPSEINQSLYFVVGIPIGAGKAAAEREKTEPGNQQ